MKRKYDIYEINQFLKNDYIHDILTNYCKYLANMYNETNEGKYRIKYNDLYRILYGNLSDDKTVEIFNSFATSLNIYPIISFGENNILLAKL